ncbi:hypothetical protein AOLI_G00298880 [Acnodon oligacanthus]
MGAAMRREVLNAEARAAMASFDLERKPLERSFHTDSRSQQRLKSWIPTENNDKRGVSCCHLGDLAAESDSSYCPVVQSPS